MLKRGHQRTKVSDETARRRAGRSSGGGGWGAPARFVCPPRAAQSHGVQDGSLLADKKEIKKELKKQLEERPTPEMVRCLCVW